jgi:hypothetical protein
MNGYRKQCSSHRFFYRSNLHIFSRFVWKVLRRLGMAMAICAACGLCSFGWTTHVFAQDASSGQHIPSTAAVSPSLVWSRSLLFRPLRANVFEPRVGAMYQSPDARLRLDIGNSLDIVAVRLSERVECRLGADFFTYTRLRSEVNFRFPVETTDFFFGLNGSIYAGLTNELAVSGRLRVAHISAHLVDGIPTFLQTFVYSREFVDAVAALEWHTQRTTWRGYVGANVLFHTIPEAFGAVTPEFGVDVMDYSTTYNLLGISWIGLCAGYDLKLPTIATITNGVTSAATSAVHAAQAGLRFGEPNATGVFVGAYWYEGKSLHGLFYDKRDSYVALGFQLDF